MVAPLDPHKSPVPEPADQNLRRPRRSGLVVAVVVVVADGIVAATLLTGQQRDAVDEPELREVRDAIAGAESFRFTFEAATTDAVFGLGDTGEPTTMRSTGSGAWTPDRWRMLVETTDSAVELALEGDTAHARMADNLVALRRERWTRHEDAVVPMTEVLQAGVPEASLFAGDEELEDYLAFLIAELVYLHPEDGYVETGDTWTTNPTIGDPPGFLDAISHMSEPQVVRESSDITTIAGVADAPDGLDAVAGIPIPDGTIEVDIALTGQPLALRFDLVQGSNSLSTEVHFSDWNQPVEIAMPTEDDIDAYPRVDEEGLRDVQDVQIVWPTNLPSDWALTVLSPDEWARQDPAETECESVRLSWHEPPSFDPHIGDEDYFSITLRSLDCALAEDPTPFRPGGPGGLPSRIPEGHEHTEVQVGETAVNITTSLPGDTLDAVAATLTPVDVETVLEAAA
jgi:hypothetical protein